ncbi:MAG: alanine dehydrogenase [Solirubrobacterales bacterium]
MRVAVVRETKTAEGRVALTPAGAREFATRGHEVLVERGAGQRAGFSDSAYLVAGARLVDRETAWGESELVLKVKEPIATEYGYLRPDLTLFTYLHLAADPPQVEALLESGATAIAYETVQAADGSLPLLAPMSEIAGRLATQAGAYFMQAPVGGGGNLIGGAPGVAPARVLVIGGGAVGTTAARVAVGMGADVVILERSLRRIRQLDDLFDGRAKVIMSDPATVAEELVAADLVIGAVLVPGRRAPHLIGLEMLGEMREGAVVVDVAIDQGGCSEASRPTTHENPVFSVEGVLHYCVANMPGAVPPTSTRALTNATLPYALELADAGIDGALASNPELASGLNVRAGQIVHPAVAAACDRPTPVPQQA